MNTRSLLAPVAAVALALTLTGCGSILDAVMGETPDAAQRDEPGGEITAAADADVFSLQVGDCLDYLTESEDTTEFSSLPTIPCAEEHDSEIFAEATLTDEQFAQGEDFFDTWCYDQFEGFVGTVYEDSALYYSYLSPTTEGWDAGDDVLQCLVVHPDGGVTGTLRDSKL